MDKAHFRLIVPPRVATLWYEGAKPWIGKPCTVTTATVAVMVSHLRKGIWLRTVLAAGSRGHGVKRAERVWSCVMLRRITAWMPIRRFLRPLCARWRKEMR